MSDDWSELLARFADGAPVRLRFLRSTGEEVMRIDGTVDDSISEGESWIPRFRTADGHAFAKPDPLVAIAESFVPGVSGFASSPTRAELLERDYKQREKVQGTQSFVRGLVIAALVIGVLIWWFATREGPCDGLQGRRLDACIASQGEPP